jgi:hypothetical protein
MVPVAVEGEIEDKAVGEDVRREIGSNGVSGAIFPVFLPNLFHNLLTSQMVAGV